MSEENVITKPNLPGNKIITPFKFDYKKIGRPLKFNDPEAVEARVLEYVEYCQMRNAPLTMSGMALYMGIDRLTLRQYGMKKEFASTVKRALDWCEAHYEEKLLSTTTTPIGLIFALKNNFGWVDKHEIEHSGKVGIDRIVERVEGRHNIIEGEVMEDNALLEDSEDDEEMAQ